MVQIQNKLGSLEPLTYQCRVGSGTSSLLTTTVTAVFVILRNLEGEPFDTQLKDEVYSLFCAEHVQGTYHFWSWCLLEMLSDGHSSILNYGQ